jgi:hypothetical protein
MKMRSMFVIVCSTLFLVGPALAQRPYNPLPPYELNIHAGGIFPDEGDSHGLLGTRFMLHKSSGWGFGGNFDWVPISDDETRFDEDVDVNTFLYSFEVDYTFRSDNPLRFFAGGGLGAASTRIDDAPDEVDDLQTDFLLPLAIGLKWFNRMDNPSWAIRLDVRDNIIWFERLNGDTDPENNWEISAGFSILFGE